MLQFLRQAGTWVWLLGHLNHDKAMTSCSGLVRVTEGSHLRTTLPKGEKSSIGGWAVLPEGVI